VLFGLRNPHSIDLHVFPAILKVMAIIQPGVGQWNWPTPGKRPKGLNNSARVGSRIPHSELRTGEVLNLPPSFFTVPLLQPSVLGPANSCHSCLFSAIPRPMDRAMPPPPAESESEENHAKKTDRTQALLRAQFVISLTAHNLPACARKRM
jgi:hypothetical protein